MIFCLFVFVVGFLVSCFFGGFFLLTLKSLLQPHNSTSRRELSNIIILLDRWQGWVLGKDPAEGKAAGSEENLHVRGGRKRK